MTAAATAETRRVEPRPKAEPLPDHATSQVNAVGRTSGVRPAKPRKAIVKVRPSMIR